jgi:hypothetical protein
MTCIRRVTRLDRLILGTRTQEEAEQRAHEPVCRLLVLRLQVLAVVALMIAVAGNGLMWELNRRDAKVARQHAAEIVANDCVDRAGDIAFRNVLVDLVGLNEGRKPSDPAIARLPRRAQTAAVLRKSLEDAGQAPTCILKVP